MPPVPLARPREVIRAFEKLGWVRRKGSHVMLSRTGQVATLSVPDHPLVARGTLRALIARAGLTVVAEAVESKEAENWCSHHCPTSP